MKPYEVTIKKKMLLYCFKADTYYDYQRRIWLLSCYIKRRYDKVIEKELINAVYGCLQRGVYYENIN